MWPALIKVEELTYRSSGKKRKAPSASAKSKKKHSSSGASSSVEETTTEPPILMILPEKTKFGRAGHIDTHGDEVPFAWFTFVKEEENSKWEDVIETKVQSYISERDEDGRSRLRYRTIYHFTTNDPLTLYDMSKLQTIEWLKRQLTTSEDETPGSVELLEAAFPIVNEIVTRQSDFKNDRNLFKTLQAKGLITDEIRGWCHDDMNMSTGGKHPREAVIQKPNDIFIDEQERSYDSSSPATPVKPKHSRT